jgi:hypothetical protein
VFGKLKLLRQQSGLHNYPVSIAWYTSGRFNGSSTVEPANNDTWNKFSFLNQLLIARKFTDKISLQLTGSDVHNNVIYYGYGQSHDVFSGGISGRYKIAGGLVNYNPNLFSFGYDWDTGGHIFQFFITNSNNASNYSQLTTNQVVSGIGQWSLGFNLNRSYSVKHIVKTHSM